MVIPNFFDVINLEQKVQIKKFPGSFIIMPTIVLWAYNILLLVFGYPKQGRLTWHGFNKFVYDLYLVVNEVEGEYVKLIGKYYCGDLILVALRFF